jgi:ribosomal protein L40E
MAEKTLGYVELEWICPNCGGKNPGSQRTCSSCGSPQPKDVVFQQAEHAELITDEKTAVAAEAGADIHCGFCGARNPATATTCSQCGGDLKEGLQRTAGQVLGAFKSAPAGEVQCRFCGTMNPDNAQTCSKCGGSLAQPKPEPIKAEQPTASKGTTSTRNPLTIGGGVLLGIILCIGLILLISFATHPEAKVGMVQSVTWERSIAIEALAPVEHQEWKDRIPAEGKLGTCEMRERETRNEPAPNSTEICGTPYTKDTGTGKGKVVQDCEYKVYDQYCKYTINEWTEVNKSVVKGSDLKLSWPSPSLQKDQRLGKRSEVYTILFDVNGKTYPYQSGNADDFTRFQSGSRWTLNINNFGSVVSVEPAK